MKFRFLAFLFPLFMVACNQSPRFVVQGQIAEATDSIVYFEHMELSKITLLDSARIKKNGQFKFKAEAPEFPDFYRLRIGNQQLVFAVDSIETINIKASLSTFALQATIEGSQESLKIQQLRQSLTALQAKINTLASITDKALRDSVMPTIEAQLQEHKALAHKIILSNPGSTSSYFAIFQKIDDFFVFSPYVKADKPYCAAVATSYYTYMPTNPRSTQLYNLVLDAIKVERQNKKTESEGWNEVLNKASKGYIDIILPNRLSAPQKLSSLEGKVVLIDFSAYQMEGNIPYTFELRELHNKFKAQGFEIFQVSLDQNKTLWERASEKIPWICVRDLNGPQTQYVNLYNVQNIPTVFLMDRQGNIVMRGTDFDTVEKKIIQLL